MLAMPGLRVFSLAAKQGSEGISCDVDGVLVSSIPVCNRLAPEMPFWSVRPLVELDEGGLTGRYQLPINIAAKASGFALIAAAFHRGDVAIGGHCRRADANSRSARRFAQRAESRGRDCAFVRDSFAAACSNFSGTLPSIRVPVSAKSRLVQIHAPNKNPVLLSPFPS